MLTQHHDRRHQERDHPPPLRQEPPRLAAALPAHTLDEQGYLIDQLIRFAFDTLGAYHLDLRVYDAK